MVSRVSPGYPNGNVSATPTDEAFRNKALLSSNAQGVTAPRGTSGYRYGPYLSKIPANPFNGLDTVQMLGAGVLEVLGQEEVDFPETADDSHGWICQPQTGEVRADNAGSDLRGKAYYEY